MSRSLLFRATKAIKWEASHVLEGLPPTHPCTRCHGHSYKAEITMRAEKLDEVGMVLDFNLMNLIKDKLDHRHLNDVMGGVNPTAENIAKFIYEALNQIILQLDCQDDVVIERVGVRETENCYAEVVMVEG